MKVQFAALLVLVAIIIVAPGHAVGITLTFEEFRGLDGTAIGDVYDGITFESLVTGTDWIARDATSGLHNFSSWPFEPSDPYWGSGEYWIYDYVAASASVNQSGYGGIIRFNNADATQVTIGYCSGYDFYLEAYDSNDKLITQDSGPGNLRFTDQNYWGPGTLSVYADGDGPIAYVIVHDSGNYWVIDNIETDASGITIRNVPPIALCQNVILNADELCQADLQPEDFDNGSFDGNNDPINITINPEGPYPVGDTEVTMTVTDDSNATSTCTAVVSVLDYWPPMIDSDAADITSKDVPVCFSVIAVDNCDVATLEITTASHTIKGKSKIVDTTDSCVIEVDVDQVCILDPGDVGNIITITATATDIHGNVTTENFTVNVLNFGNIKKKK